MKNGQNAQALRRSTQIGLSKGSWPLAERCPTLIITKVNRLAGALLRSLAVCVIPNQIAFLTQRVDAAVQANKCFNTVVGNDVVIQMLVAAEDRRFWSHRGVDCVAIARAIFRLSTSGRVEGGSTIEQQLVRTLTGYREFSLKRKLREMMLASVLAARWNKQLIAWLYLSCAYYGWRMNSLCQACDRLGYLPTTVSREQAAELVARLKYPEPRLPSSHIRVAISKRAKYILKIDNELRPYERI